MVIFHLFGEKPLLYRFVLTGTKICTERHLADVITCAKFPDEIFRGYNFTGGRISHFLLIFPWALQQQQQRYCAACDVVTHRSNYQKALSCAETRRLSYKA